MSIEYLTVADIVALHAFIMQKTGYAPVPLRDEGGLESAAMRAQAVAYYEGADVIRQSAALAVGISQAQAFLDGNTRTALIAMDVFLERNGLRFTGDDLDVAARLERIAEEIDDREGATNRFEAWLRDSTRPA